MFEGGIWSRRRTHGNVPHLSLGSLEHILCLEGGNCSHHPVAARLRRGNRFPGKDCPVRALPGCPGARQPQRRAEWARGPPPGGFAGRPHFSIAFPNLGLPCAKAGVNSVLPLLLPTQHAGSQNVTARHVPHPETRGSGSGNPPALLSSREQRPHLAWEPSGDSCKAAESVGRVWGDSKGKVSLRVGKKRAGRLAGGLRSHPPVPFSREPHAFSQKPGWVIPGMRLALTGPAGPAES